MLGYVDINGKMKIEHFAKFINEKQTFMKVGLKMIIFYPNKFIHFTRYEAYIRAFTAVVLYRYNAKI